MEITSYGWPKIQWNFQGLPVQVPTDKPEMHGWIVPRKDGLKAWCGGPDWCSVCKQERDKLK